MLKECHGLQDNIPLWLTYQIGRLSGCGWLGMWRGWELARPAHLFHAGHPLSLSKLSTYLSMLFTFSEDRSRLSRRRRSQDRLTTLFQPRTPPSYKSTSSVHPLRFFSIVAPSFVLNRQKCRSARRKVPGDPPPPIHLGPSRHASEPSSSSPPLSSPT